MTFRSWFVVFAFALLIACTFGFGLDLISALLPDIKADFNLSDSDLGDIAGFGRLGFVLGAILSGFVVTVLAPPATVFWACIGCALGMYGLSFATGGLSVAAAIFATSLFTAMSWVPMTGVFGFFVPNQHRAKAFGAIIAGAGVGTSLVGILAPYFIENHDWRLALVAAAVSTFVAMLLAAIIWRTAQISKLDSARHDVDSERGLAGLRNALDARLSGLFFMFFLVGFTVHPFQIFLSTYIRDGLGFDAVVAGNAWLTIGLVGTWAGLLMGYLGDKLGIRFTMTLAALFLCASCFVLIYFPVPVWIVIAAFVFSLSYYAMPGLLPAFISIAYSDKLSVQLFSIGSTVLGLGTVVGNVMGGRVADMFHSLAAYYWICGFAAILLALSALGFMKLNVTTVCVEVRSD